MDFGSAFGFWLARAMADLAILLVLLLIIGLGTFSIIFFENVRRWRIARRAKNRQADLEARKG